jgi:hypothetical protein
MSSKISKTLNDIEDINTMDWDTEVEIVPTPPAEQTQPAKINLEKETSAAAATGKSPAYKTPRNPYAAGSRINRLAPISVFATIEVIPEITDSKIDQMLRESFVAIFATDEEAQILPGDQISSCDPPLIKGSDLNNENLRPVYATNPRFLKKLPD